MVGASDLHRLCGGDNPRTDHALLPDGTDCSARDHDGVGGARSAGPGLCPGADLGQLDGYGGRSWTKHADCAACGRIVIFAVPGWPWRVPLAVAVERGLERTPR